MQMNLDRARTMLDGALAEAGARNAKPLAVIILDAGGHPIAFARQDKASLFRFDIARACQAWSPLRSLRVTQSLSWSSPSKAVPRRRSTWGKESRAPRRWASSSGW